ncbi:hypothetical protein TVAG_075530 [Trichomonas vaginalis G3]|uniref:Uncharacterized protein n=1 Tax=Trichomonas vaginalis (strain ATCC PRA-98 / G3) TaxID=412133 RepID=A2D9F0_TRIV3|nr:hypothetical protein TVAGG3_0286920 [Trichomonas vaginalis G3]EAY22806.1 hypothetical protein TVAG_075530 [Trichomonas vaginalis G3]KAI5526964.1 hypothetical protein TVAGG3_0286920 [Trichomonas vaginalis G3]|eukprot:XP_001583792.1 hypothetical protein [Trichomonas vaginalis G3]
MEYLNAALSGDIKSDDVLNALAINFPTVCKQKEFLNLPESVLDSVLSNKNIKYPNPKETAEFFVQVFSKGDGIAQYFSDLVPIDEMDSESIKILADKLLQMNLVQESNRFVRIQALYQTLESKQQQIDKTKTLIESASKNLESFSTRVQQSTEILRKQTKLYNDTKTQVDELIVKNKEAAKRLDDLRKQAKAAKN